jgi:hypothetical protein
MTIARAHLVDPAVSRWYHCVTRCVRRAFLLGDEHQDRKAWIERRLQQLADIRPDPVAAGIAQAPESSEHTSIKQRVDHVQAQGRTDDLAAARSDSVAGSAVTSGIEESLWLCPIEDRRGVDSLREGMIEGFTLGNYLLLVDYTGRLFREGKATISREVAEILQRLGSSADGWQARLEQLKRRGGRLLGRFFAVTRDRLRAVAKECGVHHLANLGGCAAG